MAVNGQVSYQNVTGSTQVVLLPANPQRTYLLLLPSASAAYYWWLGTESLPIGSGGRLGSGSVQVELRWEDIGALIQQPLQVYNAGATAYITVIEGFDAGNGDF